MNRIYGLLGCAALVGCGSQTLNLGGTTADSTNANLDSSDGGVDASGGSDDATVTVPTGRLSGPGAMIPGVPFCTTPPPDTWAPTVYTGASLAPLVGNWSGPGLGGDTDAGTPDQATALAFAAPDGGPVAGTMTFGTRTLPPAVDANSNYPPPAYSSLPMFPFDGFTYTATKVSFDGTILSLTLVPGELWKGWCGLQTSYGAPGAPGCSCAPNWGGMRTGLDSYDITNPATGDVVAMTGNFDIFVECNEPGNEGPPCVCSSAGCTIDMGSSDAATVSLTLTPGHLDGTLSMSADRLFTNVGVTQDVHLTLSP